MILVADASVLVAAVADSGGNGAWATEITRGETLRCPVLIYVECANGLRRMERVGDLSVIEARDALQDILNFELELCSFEPFAARIWELRHNLSCYDAWYVALAESLDCPLVTLDRRIGRADVVECSVMVPLD